MHGRRLPRATAPSTATTFVLLGAALFALARWPERRAARRYVDAAAVFVCVLAFQILALIVLGGDVGSNYWVIAGAVAVGAFLMVALAASWFFYPVWSAEVIPYTAWQIRMWFPTWV